MYALHISKDTGGIDTSIFSKEWDQYGYEEMSLDEINELLTQPKYSILKDVDYETFGKHNVIWKNEHMNYLDAQLGALEIRSDIEPIPETFAQVKRNTELNQSKNIILNNVALSDKIQTLTFFYSPTVTGASSSVNITENDSMVKLECQTNTIDHFVKEKNITKDGLPIIL